MDAILDALSRDHHHIDELFARAEAEATQGDLAAAGPVFSEYRRTLERHIDFEEQTLFPALSKLLGPGPGPLQVMRIEHERIRALLHEIAEALAARDRGRCRERSEMLRSMMQQHNAKEEGVLYRLADRLLGHAGAELLAGLNRH